jgi:hypothetical protein
MRSYPPVRQPVPTHLRGGGNISKIRHFLVLDVQKPADSDSDLVTVLVVLKRYINSIGNSFHDIYVYNII